MSAASSVHALLPWYLNGTLESRLADEFRMHLSGCEACRREMALLEELQAELKVHGEAFLLDHPTAERVVAFVRGELGVEEAAAVRKHVVFCGSCAEESSWVAGEAAYEATAPREQSRSSIFRPWNWAAAVAATILLVSVPLFLISREEGLPTGVVKTRHLEAPERGAREVVTYRLNRSGISVMLSADFPDESFPLRIELVDAQGRVVHEESVVRDDLLYDYLNFHCRPADCPVGEYTMRLRARDATAPELSIPFRVVE